MSLPEIKGHPVLELDPAEGSEPVVITVCSECGEMRTILWLDRDRWYCRSCRAAGAKPPNLYPIR